MNLNNKGFSIPGTIIAVGIAIYASTIMVTILTTQFRETKALQEKLASLDLEKLLIITLSDGSVCSHIMNNPNPITFDSTHPLPQKLTPSLPIYSNVTSPTTPGPPVAEVGTTASGFSDSLIIKSINLELLSESGGTYLGNWVIEFDGENTVRQIRPLKISTVITADLSIPTAATVTNCQNTGDSGKSGGVYGYSEGSAPSSSFSTSERTVVSTEINSTGDPFVIFYNAESTHNTSHSNSIWLTLYENGTAIDSKIDDSCGGASYCQLKVTLSGNKRRVRSGPVTYEIKVGGQGSANGSIYAIDVTE